MRGRGRGWRKVALRMSERHTGELGMFGVGGVAQRERERMWEGRWREVAPPKPRSHFL